MFLSFFFRRGGVPPRKTLEQLRKAYLRLTKAYNTKQNKRQNINKTKTLFSSLPGAGPFCQIQFDLTTCCSFTGTSPRCDTLTCPNGYLSKLNAAIIPCQEHVCELDNDLHTCCDLRSDESTNTWAPAACADIGTCPTDYAFLTGKETLTCRGATCDLNWDWERCCWYETAPPIACGGAFQCPTGFVKREVAGLAWLMDDLVWMKVDDLKNDMSIYTCCKYAGDDKAKCDTLRPVENWVYKLDAATEPCYGPVRPSR